MGYKDYPLSCLPHNVFLRDVLMINENIHCERPRGALGWSLLVEITDGQFFISVCIEYGENAAN